MAQKLWQKSEAKRLLFENLLLVAIYGLGYLITSYTGIFSCALLLIAGIFYYLYFSFIGERSFLKFKAVFSGVWLCTIGLSQLSLLEYQSKWIFLTWVNLLVAHLFFLLANDLAKKYFPIFEDKFNLNKLNRKNSFVEYKVKQERYFWIATVVTLFGILCFVINIIIKGYIPFFVSSSNTSAYYDFYTRLHTFVVASMVCGGLAYYCLKRCHLSKMKNVLVSLYIIILVFIIPILLVQRGTFITIALILTAVIYLMSNRKFWVLFLCLVVMFGVYLFGSSLRGYTDTQLNNFFQPKEITIGNPNEASSFIPKETFKLSPKVAFLYSYLTVSQDNFNSAVEHKTNNTWGIWQVKPFNVAFRSAWINEKLQEAQYQSKKNMVLPNLNTFNLISMAYYDFGIIGVILLISLWSFLFGIVEAFNRKYKGVFSSLAYGVCLIPVALCFFDPWMSNFTFWLLLGSVFLMFLAASFSFRKRGVKQ